MTATAVSIDEYLDSMRVWIRTSVHRSVRKESASLFAREDMEQEARCALLEVWNNPRYAGLIAAGDLDQLQKVGRRAIFFHTGNLYYRSGSASPRCGECDACRSKYRRPCKELSLIGIEDLVGGVTHATGRDHELTRLVVREAVEQIAAESAQARAAISAVLDIGDSAPAHLADGDQIFGTIQRRVREAIDGQQCGCRITRKGYARCKGHRAAHTPQGGRHMDPKGGPESPDILQPAGESTGPVTATAPAEKPKRSHKKKPTSAAPAAAQSAAKAPAKASVKADKKVAKKAGSARQSAAETKAASTSFKKDDKVVYLGGGRAAWLKKDATLQVTGTVMSRGRMYVRCIAVADKKKISISSALLKKKA